MIESSKIQRRWKLPRRLDESGQPEHAAEWQVWVSIRGTMLCVA